MFEKNISLKPYNTFGVEVWAEQFVEVLEKKQLLEVLKKYPKALVLSAGSNVLFTKNILEPVIKLNLKGISVQKKTENKVFVSAKAGENWHDFVLWTLEQGWGGLENLSFIPGNVGACPIQNIGAYGVEVKDVLKSVTFLDKNSLQEKTLPAEFCEFGYRDSIFKKSLKNKVVITEVLFELTSKNHLLKTNYGAIENILKTKNIKKPTPKNISDAVIQIRKEKLPDPQKIGNAGSFFKNPIVKKTHLEQLLKENSEMPYYAISEEKYKIPAGWLVEKIGFKGKKMGAVGVHQKQALVLVNYGKGTGAEILFLAKKIQKCVLKTFGIALEIEVNLL